ncbi:efflux RND transporter periplasmic adaptor subunit [Sphingomonas gilva]|uniref:Efflux RND transporter periplasmic adaptor subunit n=1 Tax=Sphingomonas gilva TaxID=2305907 RepID=A0A396RS59_9SPHN|nr:efflux RND transporter periplasmic adaptor subunit [Sphingomonas gilva]RHW18162.1 efflux RND transporter periplasmic adaptor subunit [Sphingomonas gilva]
MHRPTTFRTLGLATAGALLLAGCGGAEAPPAPPPPEVTVHTVTPEDVTNVVELPGRVQAIRTAEVRARVNGIVQRRLYNEGSDVRAGQALFAIDPRELRASLNAVQATLARARANAANAQQVVNRYKGLVADQAISRQEYDAAIAQLRTAEADVANARAQVQSAQLNLNYATVTSPIAGRSGRAQVTEGALVSAAEGTLMTTVEQIDRVYVNFGQSSADLLNIRQDIQSGKLKLPDINRVAVNLVLEDGSTYAMTGYLDFLGLSIDQQTGTAALRAEFPNPQRLLVPGQFVRARIQAGTRPDGMLVPQRAVRIAQDGATVMVLGQGNKAEARKIKVGEMQGGDWVVTDGLKAGDKVIVDGLQKVQPGQPVSVAKPGGPPPSAQRQQPAPAR